MVPVVVVVSIVIVPAVDVAVSCEDMARFDLTTVVNRAMSWIVNMSRITGISIANFRVDWRGVVWRSCLHRSRRG